MIAGRITLGFYGKRSGVTGVKACGPPLGARVEAAKWFHLAWGGISLFSKLRIKELR